MNIYVGLTISGLVLLILGVVADIFDIYDFHIDIGDVEVGNMEIAFLPFSLRALSLGLIVYCSMCLWFGDGFPTVIVNGVVAYLSAVAVSTLTKFLKKHEKIAKSESKYLSSKAVVYTHIPENNVGVVTCALPKEAVVTFTAKSKDSKAIKVGTEVKIVGFENGITIVE